MTEAIAAIDVHGHIGKCRGAPSDQINEITSGDAQVVVKRAALARTKLTFVSPLEGVMAKGGGNPVLANQRAAQEVLDWDELMQWVVVDPTKPRTFGQAEEMLKSPKCAGIKIHPEEHGYAI